MGIGRKVVYGSLIATALILIDVFSRFLFAQSWFSTSTLKKEFDPFAILSLILTLAVTLWLGWYVSKKVSEQRYEKEFIISEIRRIEEEINRLEHILLGSSIELEKILAILINLKIYIDRSYKTAEIFNVQNLMQKQELDKYYTLLYKKTTNLDSNILKVDNVIRTHVNKICSELILKTRLIIFKINKN